MGLNRDFLKGLDLDKSTIDAIMSEHGATVTELKEKIDGLEESNKTLKADSEAYTQLKADYETLKTEKDGLETAKTNAEKERDDIKADNDTKMKQLKKDFAINKAIAKSKAIDEVSFRAHLDMSKIEYDAENDTLTGYEEQEKDIKENYSFLFGENSTGGEHGGIEAGKGEVTSIADGVNDYYK